MVPLICIESRYRKLQRGLPQTIFYCPDCRGSRRRRVGCQRCDGFGKLTRTSVQELIGRRAVPRFKAKEGRFHGAGREDIDVLMLGAGRPFVFELVKPRAPDVDLEALRADIVERAEGAIELAPFRVVERDRIGFWKQGCFEKEYRVEVTSAAGLPGDALARLSIGEPMEIAQRTPQRVVHRRADLTRDRQVVVLEARYVGDSQLELEVRTQHGTYVKEWVSGDEGRTSPSVADLLGTPSICSELDVLEILTPDDPSPGPAPDPAP